MKRFYVDFSLVDAYFAQLAYTNQSAFSEIIE